jgi:hypothetical protein
MRLHAGACDQLLRGATTAPAPPMVFDGGLVLVLNRHEASITGQGRSRRVVHKSRGYACKVCLLRRHTYDGACCCLMDRCLELCSSEGQRHAQHPFAASIWRSDYVEFIGGAAD